MKALVATDYGDVDKLEFRDMPNPSLGEGQVRVKVTAAGLNPIDWKLLTGQRRAMMPLQFPAVLGRDASGEVLEVGAGVKGLRPGDKVLGLAWGTFAEQVVAAEDAWAKLPAHLDPIEAAAVPLVVLTGAQLVDLLPIKKGETVLVTGAVGSVGRTAVFVAKSRGASVWAGVRTQQKSQAQSLGVEAVVAIDDDAEIAKLPQFAHVADTVGGATIAKLLPHMKKGGTLGSVLGEPPGAKEQGVKVAALLSKPNSGQLAQLAQAVAEGKLTIPVARRFPLAQGAEAIRFAREGSPGKVLLIP
jgi:NADPH:quinone reductase-like Zn-dependent oxidoreductase